MMYFLMDVFTMGKISTLICRLLFYTIYTPGYLMDLKVGSLEYLCDGHWPYNDNGKEKTKQILHGFVTRYQCIYSPSRVCLFVFSGMNNGDRQWYGYIHGRMGLGTLFHLPVINIRSPGQSMPQPEVKTASRRIRVAWWCFCWRHYDDLLKANNVLRHKSCQNKVDSQKVKRAKSKKGWHLSAQSKHKAQDKSCNWKYTVVMKVMWEVSSAFSVKGQVGRT